MFYNFYCLSLHHNQTNNKIMITDKQIVNRLYRDYSKTLEGIQNQFWSEGVKPNNLNIVKHLKKKYNTLYEDITIDILMDKYEERFNKFYGG